MTVVSTGRSLGGHRAAARSEVAQRAAPPVGRRGLLHRLLRSTAVLGWLLAWLAGTAAAATAIVPVDVPAGLARPLAEWGAGVVGVLHAVAVAHRLGGRTRLWGLLAVVAVVGALVSERDWALGGVSALTAIVSGLAAVLVTRPAATAARAVLEFVVALVVAAAGAVAVAGLDAPIDTGRYTLLVVGASLPLAVGLVWQLGAGLHGLGRRSFALIVGAAVLVTALLAYTEVLRLYGSPAIVERVDESVQWMSTTLGGVPRPVEALVGFPALVWGVGTRASRRQGWWLCAFGVLGTAALAASLAPPRLDPEYAALSASYSALIGLVLGLLLWRVDRAVTGRREAGGDARRRVLRTGEVSTIRPEPGRTRPLR